MIGRVLRTVRWALRHYGVKKTLLLAPSYAKRVAQSIAETMEGFDRRYSTDTSGYVDGVDFGVGDEATKGAMAYQACRVAAVQQMLSAIDADLSDYVFVDYGCGKGRALLVASDWPFSQIVGVELSPPLAEVAERNFKVYRSASQRCDSFDVHAVDARAYEPPDRPLVLFFNNPFAPQIFAEVLDTIEASLRRHPRAAYVIYSLDVYRDVVSSRDWLTMIAEGQYSRLGGRWSLYRHSPSA